MTCIKFEIPTASTGQSEILIAELSHINFYSFEENENSLSAFINDTDLDEDALQEVLAAQHVSCIRTEMPDTNWNAKWESEFEPVVIENLVAVRADFHQPVHGVRFDIIITPRMSFGTGHHATTFLMLQEMGHMKFNGKSVLDFGTGTGVLAIMAEMMGAKKVLAIDNDVWSIRNANENVAANACVAITVKQASDLEGMDEFDIIVANINLHVITGNASQLAAICYASSQLLLSGFLHTDEAKVANIFMEKGFQHIHTSHKGEWISMLLTKS